MTDVLEPEPTTDSPKPLPRRHPLARCEDCAWNTTRTGYADATGPEDAKVVIIGEAPGRVEAQQGIPFVGPSGKLLDKVLAHHGFDRDQIRLTNVVACSPPSIHNQKGATAPPKDVIACCRPRLNVELKDRETIICLGNTAKAAVLETTEAITRVRQGPPREHPKYPGAKIIATIHPAACLRSSDHFPSLVKDIRKAANSHVITTWEPPKFKAYDDDASASGVLHELLQRGGNDYRISVDIEVGAEKDSSFTHPDDLLCVGMGIDGNRAVVIGEQALKSKRVQYLLKKLLSLKYIICHNGKYDLQVLMRLGIIDEPRLAADSMLGNYCLDERPGHHSLEGVSVENLGSPAWKNELDLYKGKNDSYAVIPRDILYRYNAFDCANTYNVWNDAIEPHLIETGLKALHDRLVMYSNEMVYLELDGVKVDMPYLQELDVTYLQKLVELEEPLQAWVNNPRSPKQVLAAIKGLRLPANDTTAETLKNLFESPKRTEEQLAFLGGMLDYRKEFKLHSTYIKGIYKRLLGDRVYPTYLIHGTVSGRLSSRNPNAQNIPRGSLIRKMFIPEEGNTFVQGDYGQAEIRVAACYARDKYLREVFSDPTRDIHGEVCTQLVGPNYTKEQRVRAKAVVFGLTYGREAMSIAKEYKMSVREAEAYVKAFFSLIPEVVAWREDVKKRTFSSGQALQTDFGRRRRFHLITRENKMDVEKEALSFLPQSTANDICLSALVRLRKSFGTAVGAPRLRIPVHDSLLVECANADREEVAIEMKHTMELAGKEEFSDYVPFNVDIESGPSWGELKEFEFSA